MLSVVVNNLPSIDKKDIVFLNIGKIIIRISKENVNIVSIIEKKLSLPISIIILLLIYIWMAKWYEERLNSINYSINILESIKEDIYFQREKESKEDDFRYRVDSLNSLNSFKENKSDGILENKKMQRDKRLASNFTKEEYENSLVNKASKISFLILFLFRMKKKMNDKK